MKRWVDTEAARLLPQEMALLALSDRLTVLEQAFTAELDRHAMTRKRLDHVQKELNAAHARLGRLEGDHRAIFRSLGREE